MNDIQGKAPGTGAPSGSDAELAGPVPAAKSVDACPRRKRPVRVMLRLLVLLVLAWAVGAVLNRLAASLDSSTQPAGFGRGALQGALMPMALPNLLVGRNVTIYSQNNTGVTYKLGYTTGVNVCGACFFGVLYWRLSRWRQVAWAP